MAKKKPGAADDRRIEEWAGGILEFPILLRDEPDVKPVVVIWLDARRWKIVAMKVVDEHRGVQELADLLSEAQARPAWGSPRRPGRLRLADEELACALREKAGVDIPMVVADTPELDDVAKHLREKLAGAAERPGADSYLGEGRIPAECVAQFMASAARLFPRRPWSRFRDAPPFSIDCPALGLSQAVLLTAGFATDSPGLMLVDSFADYLQLTEPKTEDEGPAEGKGPGIPLRTVGFHRGADVPDSMRREVMTHGWQVASPQAYPLPGITDARGVPQNHSERDLVVLTACIDAMGEAVGRHAEAVAAGRPFLLDVPVALSTGPTTARLSWPHPRLLELDDGGVRDNECDEDDEGEWSYDGGADPDPAQWREADEDEKSLAVETHHRKDRPHGKVPNLSLHAKMHVVVENQLADDEPPAARRALLRLRDAGIGRHEATHAIASVLTAEMFGLMKGTLEPDPKRYATRLDEIDAGWWRKEKALIEAAMREERGAPRRRRKRSGK